MDPSPALTFGRFELQARQRRLLQDGEPVTVGARAFDLLLALVERRDRVVTKTELLDIVWPGLVVEENNLQVQVSSLRKVLGTQAIATIPGRGYRFTAALDGASDGTLSASRRVVAPLPKAIDAVAASLSNLPQGLPPLFGREADLTALRSLIVANRLVTVVGAGGIGKSRLAQAAAHAQAGSWSDGAWMVELAGLSDPGLLPSVVAQALAMTITGQGATFDEVVAGLAQRTLLLVLDNCEHLLDAAAALALAVMQGAPNVTLLATSQEPLHLQIEQQYRVAPLAVPSESAAIGASDFGAIALFEARVRAVDPRFALNGEGLAVAIDICRRLDGLPLAIELAAARVATIGLHPVRDKLDARFKLLTGGSRATLRRHQTLRAALEWSHQLLNDAEKAVFRRLGVFAGGFTMETAQAVAADTQLDAWAVLEHLSALVDKSLVVAGADDPPRYRLLESARAFALEQLASGEMAATLQRHALAMLEFLKRVDGANLDGELLSDQYAALVLPELDNLRVAHAWAIGDAGNEAVAAGLAAHAGSLVDYAVEFVDWLVPLQHSIEAGGIEPAIAARYWRALAAGNMVHRVPHALQIEASVRARSLYQALGQPRRVCSSLIELARHRRVQHSEVAAQDAADEARGLIQPDWPALFRTQMLRTDASIARNAGRFSEAVALSQDAVRASVSTGDLRREMTDRCNLVDLLWQCGPIEEAAREASNLADALRARPTTYFDMDTVFANLAGILSEMGRIEEASASAREALPMMRITRDYFIEMWVYLFWRRSQFDVATVLLGASDAKRIRDDMPLHPNELRLIAQARSALEAKQHPVTFANHHATGAALSERSLLTLVSNALEQPVAHDR